MVATAMPQQLSSIAVSGPPASTPVSGLPTSSSRQSSCMEASPRATASTFSPNALLYGTPSENIFWKSATRSSGVVSGAWPSRLFPEPGGGKIGRMRLV